MIGDKGLDEDHVARVTSTMSLKKLGRPEDVAAQVVALASDRISGHVSGQVAHRALRGLQLLLHRLCVGQQGLARLGETDVATDAVEELRAQLLLQQGDALAHRRLGQV